MGLWSKASRTHVSHMSRGDFYGNEQAHLMAHAGAVQIVLEKTDGTTKVLKESVKLEENELIDASFMSVAELQDFYENELEDAYKNELMVSLHLKATMMKVRVIYQK